MSVAVYPETKEAWLDAAEDPNADSLSQFVRVAVQRYLQDRAVGGRAELFDEVRELLGELDADHDRIVERLDRLDERLEGIEADLAPVVVSDEVAAVAEDIFETLPRDGSIPLDAPNTDAETIAWLAKEVEAPTYRVREALEHLDATTMLLDRRDRGAYHIRE